MCEVPSREEHICSHDIFIGKFTRNSVSSCWNKAVDLGLEIVGVVTKESVNDWDDGVLSKENTGDSHSKCTTKLEYSVLRVSLLDAIDFGVYSLEIVHVVNVDIIDIGTSFLHSYMSFYQDF